MELFHVLNRGVDGRAIFMDARDRVRFVHDMYEFNDSAASENVQYHFGHIDSKDPHINEHRRLPRNCLVDIHGWCLMPNHYHLLLSEKTEGGMTQFIRKLNVGYARYFNERHERKGTLFQSRTKKILINNDAHFLHILHYIHLNPLDLLRGAEDWRQENIESATLAMRHLDSYRWSSFQDYCGKKNFPSLLTTNLFSDVLGDIKQATRSFLKDREIERLSSVYKMEI